MLQKLVCPGTSPTDHLFVGTDRFTYFTVSWDSEKRQLRTERSYVDLADKSSRDSLTGDRCLVDPSGQFMTLEIYEGVVTVIPIVQASARQQQDQRKKAKQVSGSDRVVGELGEPCQSRIEELVVRSSAFLYPQSNQKPRLALLYEDSMKRLRLKVRELVFVPGGAGDGASAELKERDVLREELEMGASQLIPVPAPLGEFFLLLSSCPPNGKRRFGLGL
jgi:DNA damage-binding protein 1